MALELTLKTMCEITEKKNISQNNKEILKTETYEIFQ